MIPFPKLPMAVCNRWAFSGAVYFLHAPTWRGKVAPWPYVALVVH